MSAGGFTPPAQSVSVFAQVHMPLAIGWHICSFVRFVDEDKRGQKVITRSPGNRRRVSELSNREYCPFHSNPDARRHSIKLGESANHASFKLTPRLDGATNA